MAARWAIEKNYILNEITVKNQDEIIVATYDISMYSINIIRDSHISIQSVIDGRTVFYSHINNVIFYSILT